jgi:hypothetical protein
MKYTQQRCQRRACRVEAFSDPSIKVQGFTPGYHVAVIGDCPTEAETQQQLENARRCVPGAYSERALHLGE